MGRLWFLVFSVALASALPGLFAAWSEARASRWSASGDGLLFWLKWAGDPGVRRLILAFALAAVVLIVAAVTKDSRNGLLRAYGRVVGWFSRPIPALAALALALLPHVVAPLKTPDAAGKPSIVIVLLDTVRLDHVGWGGSELPTTPRLDALAREGAAFTQAISQSSWTKPSVASLLCGVVPGSHLATGQPTKLAPDRRTAADAFSAAGYKTYGISNNPNISYTFNFDQGFTEFHQGTSEDADTLIARARRWVAPHQESDDPFLLYLHLNDAHYPYVPRDVSVTRKGEQKIRGIFNPQGSSPRLDGETQNEFRKGKGLHTTLLDGGFTKEDVELMRLSYAEEIRWLDDQAGDFLEELMEKRDDLIVIVLSDHGEEFLEHGDLGHGHTLFDELVRVPLMVAWSKALGERLGLSSGVRDEQVRTVDLLPTVLEACGLHWPAGAVELQGASLMASLRGDAAVEDRPAFAETDLAFSPLSGPTGPLRMWRESDAKLVITDPFHQEVSGRYWVFDLASDPGEQRNVAGEDAALLERLERALNRSNLVIQHALASEWEVGLNSQQQAELAALGYAGDVGELKSDADAAFAPGTIRWWRKP
jgi:arylsulfatase A-like enzyme